MAAKDANAGPSASPGASGDLTAADEANFLLDSVLDNAPVAIAIIDRGLRRVRTNTALNQAEDLPDVAADDIEAVFAGGAAITRTTKVGDQTWSVCCYPIKLGDEVRFVGAVFIDETERAAAERAADQLGRLQSITALLSGAKNRDDVCTVVIHQGMAGVGAANGTLCLLTDDATEMELVRAIGLSPETQDNWARFPADAPVPACDAVRTGQMVMFSSLEERDELYPVFKGTPAQSQAFATVPLSVGDRPFGAVTFGWRTPRSFSAEDRQFLAAVGEQCSQALDRCRLYEAEARERTRKEFVAEAGALLASSLDYETTIERVARLVLPELADACVVHVRTPDGMVMVTAAHVDPEHERIIRQLGSKDDRIARHFRLHEVADSRQALLVERISPTLWDDVVAKSEERAWLQRLGLQSGMAVPLVASGECVGVLSMAMSVSGRTYSVDDLAVAEGIGERAAVAIHNARSHRALRDIAQTLQRSLLPAESPAIPGLDVAAVYHPVSESVVGGDFYDVFPVGPNKWGVVVGDVCGKGVQAASLTALARYTVRTASIGAESPSAVLERLNQAILDEGSDERFCTIAHLIVEPGDGAATITMACGGHPLPLLLGADGSLRPVGRPGSGIGMFPEPDLVDSVHTLGPGDALVLYTDGVLEARAPDGAFHATLLDDALAKAAGSDAAGIAAAVEDAVLAFEGGKARDDMAVLVVRVPA